jgi:hypothetical protein
MSLRMPAAEGAPAQAAGGHSLAGKRPQPSIDVRLLADTNQ